MLVLVEIILTILGTILWLTGVIGDVWTFFLVAGILSIFSGVAYKQVDRMDAKLDDYETIFEIPRGIQDEPIALIE